MHRIFFERSLHANVSFASYGIVPDLVQYKQKTGLFSLILYSTLTSGSSKEGMEKRKQSLDLALFMLLLTIGYPLILVGIQTLSLP